MTKPVREIDRGWKRIKRGFFKLGPDAVRVGIQGSVAEEEREDAKDLTNVKLAAIHEFGAPKKNIRKRSFLASTFDEHRKKYLRQLNKIGRDLVTGKVTRAAGLNLLGEEYRDDIIAKIMRGKIKPGLKPATVARRAARAKDKPWKKGQTENVPLFDFGLLVDSIRSVLEK